MIIDDEWGPVVGLHGAISHTLHVDCRLVADLKVKNIHNLIIISYTNSHVHLETTVRFASMHVIYLACWILCI